MRFIDELRKCDPTRFIQAPTQEEDPKRAWVSTPIGHLLSEWDELIRDRDRYKAQSEYWLQAATGVTPSHYGAGIGELREEDLRVGHFHVKGDPVNHGPRGVSIEHIPTGTVAEAWNERSQLENTQRALQALRLALERDDST